MSDKEYSLEELNYFRVCYITTKIIRDGLRSVFKQEWDGLYERTLGKWLDTHRNGQDFFNMESRRSRKKNRRLLNIIQYRVSSQWDCTCLFFAILFSDSLGGPVLNPTVASNVNDLRDFRNGFSAHLSQSSVLESDFQANVQRVTNAFMALNLDTKDLQIIINQRSFPTGQVQKLQEQIAVLEEEIQGKPKSFVVLPPKPSHKVIKRKAEVENIMQMFSDLQNNNEDGSIVTVYVSGNPGCGKSQTARQVGKTFADENQDGSTFVMTLNAESEESMLDSYKIFARALGITEYSLNSIARGDSKLTRKEQLLHLKAFAFSKVQGYSAWLVIFDNVNELENLTDCWPDDEEWGGCGQVLVTIQDSVYLPFGDPFCEAVSLSEGMQTKDALNLLRSISQFSSSDKEEEEEEEHLVLEALDYQPLAIASAALYVRYVHDGTATRKGPGSFTWKSYLKKLEMGKRIATENVYEAMNMKYPQSMTSAVSLTLQTLVKNPVFERVFQFLALCSPAPIALDVIIKFVTNMEQDLDEDLTATEVSKCCLLMQLCPDTDSPPLMRVHQVVHEVSKSHFLWTNTEDKVSVLIESFIGALSLFSQHDLLQFDLQVHLFSKTIAPHLMVFSNHLEASNWALDATSRKRNQAKETVLYFGDICNTQGYLPTAKTYFECALNIASGDGEGSNDDKYFIATTLNNIGVVYLKQGKFEVAKDYHQRALDLFQSLNPTKSSPEIADSLNKLGNVFYSLSQFQAAKEYFIKSPTMREEIYGKEDASVASSLNNLGSVYSVLGEHQIAKDYYKRSLALAEKLYGKIHPLVADCLCNLGIVYSELGAIRVASQYHEKGLEMRKKLYQPNHLVISESYNNLGLMHKGAGQLVQALDCYKSALSIRENVLDQEHPALAEVLSNLGQVYMDLGEIQESKDCHFRARDIRMGNLESDHSELGDSMLNLGMVFEQCCELREAADYYEQALQIYAKSYPMNHQLCQSAAECLKRVSQQQADLDDQHHRSQRPDHFTARIWSSMTGAVRRSKLLNYPFAGAHLVRLVRTSANVGRLEFMLISLMVAFYLEGANTGVLKKVWLMIPYIIGMLVVERAMQADCLFNNFKLLHNLKFLGFLYLLGYVFQSYL